MVEGDGFEPPNPMGADLQSAAFSLFATPPDVWYLNAITLYQINL